MDNSSFRYVMGHCVVFSCENVSVFGFDPRPMITRTNDTPYSISAFNAFLTYIVRSLFYPKQSKMFTQIGILDRMKWVFGIEHIDKCI